MFKTIRLFYHLLNKRHKHIFLVTVASLMINTIFEVFSIGSIVSFLVILLSPEKLYQLSIYQETIAWLGVSPSYHQVVISISVIMLALLLLRLVAYSVSQYLFARFSAVLTHHLRYKLFNQYMHQDYLFYLNQDTASLVNVITNEMQVFYNYVLTPITNILINGFYTLGILLLMLAVAPLATVMIVVMCSAIYLIFHWLFLKNLHLLGERRVEANEKIAKTAMEGLGSIKVTKILHKEDYFVDQLDKFSKQLKHDSVISSLSTLMPRPLVEFAGLSSIIIVMLILLMVVALSPHHIIIIMSVLALAAARIIPGYNQVLSSISRLKYGHYTISKIQDNLDSFKPYLPETHRTEATPAFKQQIQLQDIQFSYPGTEQPVLRGITLEIPYGKSIGIVGESGAGKSTLVDILLGLIHAEGTFLSDGRPFDPQSRQWQGQIGYVPQSIFLTDATIADNIAFGIAKEDVDHQALAEAIELAQLSDFISNLPNGLNTMVGEQGVRLSGGQRQRIGIARALYHKPKLLVMDEATSALDNKTESAFLESLRKLHGFITMVVVAHRLTTIQECDNIVMIDQGQIIVTGTYKALMAKRGPFKSLATKTLNTT